MRALTIRQPWAWAIIYGGKDVENRTWTTTYRGQLLIHAGLAWAPDHEKTFARTGSHPPRKEEVAHGAIVGVVRLVDVVRDSESPWAEPDFYHLILADPCPISPVPCTGKLGLWVPPENVVERIERLTRIGALTDGSGPRSSEQDDDRKTPARS